MIKYASTTQPAFEACGQQGWHRPGRACSQAAHRPNSQQCNLEISSKYVCVTMKSIFTLGRRYCYVCTNDSKHNKNKSSQLTSDETNKYKKISVDCENHRTWTISYTQSQLLWCWHTANQKRIVI